MVDRAAELGAPFMAGSSLVLAWRRPWLEHPLGAELEEAVAIGYAAPLIVVTPTMRPAFAKRGGLLSTAQVSTTRNRP